MAQTSRLNSWAPRERVASIPAWGATRKVFSWLGFASSCQITLQHSLALRRAWNTCFDLHPSVITHTGFAICLLSQRYSLASGSTKKLGAGVWCISSRSPLPDLPPMQSAAKWPNPPAMLQEDFLMGRQVLQVLPKIFYECYFSKSCRWIKE